MVKALSKAVLVTMLAASAACIHRSNPNSSTNPDPPRLTESSQEALEVALQDERRAQVLYRAIMDRFGEVRPFVNIMQAEIRHEQELLALFDLYGLEVPPPRVFRIAVPDTFQEACALGVESELTNIAMYDELLASVQEPQIRATFLRLRDASLNRHLPAFQRCA